MELIKYKNRKIYSPNLKRYVTLNEVVEGIRNGEEITIRAHETNADVTDDTLKQCLLLSNLNRNDLINIINKGL